MKQKIDNGKIYIIPDEKDISTIRGWRLLKENKAKGYWVGDVSRTLLIKIKALGGLIPQARRELDRLNKIQEAVDKERVKPDDEVKPLYEYPVKAGLYKHQIRAANMALMVFGVAEPEGGAASV